MSHQPAEGAADGKREMVGDAVLRTLLDEIVSGRWPEGGALPSEAALSGRFAVSRTALREAMRHLVAHGIVEARTRAGTVVLPRHRWNLLDPGILAAQLRTSADGTARVELREALFFLMPRAAALAAERASAAQVAVLEQGLPNAASGLGANAFYAALFDATGNWVFRQLGQLIGTALETDPVDGSERGPDWEKTSRWQKALFDAIRQQKADDARAAMKKLLALQREEPRRAASAK